MPPYLIMAFLGALFFSVGGFFSKYSMENGCGPLRMIMMMAWSAALLLCPVIILGGAIPLQLLWQPFITALCWFSGSVLFVYTVRDGDLSLAGPLLGIKPVFNALLIFLILGEPIGDSVWAAAILSGIALFIMRSDSSPGKISYRRTLLNMLGIVFLFALTDLFMQQWGERWGGLRFVAFVFLFGALFSLALIRKFGTSFRRLSAPVKRLGILSAILLALPGILIGGAISLYGKGAEVNVVANVHVILTLFLVWVLGRRMGNQEGLLGVATHLRRLAGAILLLLSVVLILFVEN